MHEVHEPKLRNDSHPARRQQQQQQQQQHQHEKKATAKVERKTGAVTRRKFDQLLKTDYETNNNLNSTVRWKTKRQSTKKTNRTGSHAPLHSTSSVSLANEWPKILPNDGNPDEDSQTTHTSTAHTKYSKEVFFFPFFFFFLPRLGSERRPQAEATARNTKKKNLNPLKIKVTIKRSVQDEGLAFHPHPWPFSNMKSTGNTIVRSAFCKRIQSG